jgi:hypothetical protein
MKVTRQRMERLADHPHDDTIIAAARSLLADRAAKMLTTAQDSRAICEGRGETMDDETYKAMLKVAALCTYAASTTESALQAIADFEIRYGEAPDAT